MISDEHWASVYEDELADRGGVLATKIRLRTEYLDAIGMAGFFNENDQLDALNLARVSSEISRDMRRAKAIIKHYEDSMPKTRPTKTIDNTYSNVSIPVEREDMEQWNELVHRMTRKTKNYGSVLHVIHPGNRSLWQRLSAVVTPNDLMIESPQVLTGKAFDVIFIHDGAINYPLDEKEAHEGYVNNEVLPLLKKGGQVFYRAGEP